MALRERFRHHLLDLIGLALSLLYALPALAYPHGNDQALHWYVGQGLLLGELPYVDTISGKPLGIFIIHALASTLFGPGQLAIRLFELPTLALCAYLCTRLLRAPGATPRAGAFGTCCVLTFGGYYTYFDYWDTAHPELWEATCILLASVVALHDARPTRRALLCGAACGAAFMIKYPAAVIALPISMVSGLRAVLEQDGVGARVGALFREAGLFLVGAGAVFAACLAPYVLTGQLAPMWEVLVTLLSRYAGQASIAPPSPRWILLVHGGVFVLSAGVVGLVGIARQRDRHTRLVAALLLVLNLSAFASVWLQARFFPYHYVVATPFLVAAMWLGLREAGGRVRALPMLLAGAWVAASFVLAPRWCTAREHSYRAHVAQWTRYIGGELGRDAYLAPFIGYNFLDHYAVHEHIGLEIRQRATPRDTLCVRGFAPAVYQVAGLRCPSRHVMQPAPAGLPRWEIEFFEDVRRAPPRFIVSFSDRKHEQRLLRSLGYARYPMESLYVLGEREPPVPPPGG